MFADLHLARRIEGAEASLSREIGEATAATRRRESAAVFVRPLAGGVAVCTGADSPVTKVIGVGFEGVPSDEALDEMERAFFDRGASVRAEVAALADPALYAILSRRGYVLEGFENVLGLDLRSAARAEMAAHHRAEARQSQAITVSRTTDERLWKDVVIGGFEHPDTGVVSAPGESFPRETLERIYDDMAASGGFLRYLARIGDQAVGGACLRLCEGVAQLAGAATLPAYRRRGVQTEMLNARLREAVEAGCDIAVVTTQPGSKSQQNAQRHGFALLYTRAILVKRPERH
jgi:GNAT superfamily N-acetyltransferase